ncbi:MAG: nucleotidyl transferase AbiEii/AbiGii toxin family protein [Deltaproteobacteria bacterium]|nr:nucleotidyl transferase AbiEii/AbiGii toxin family protein [Deltaproteobacteria bacterium]
MFELLLEKIALSLDEAKIPYMVIGGQAVLLHGEPRLTRDIDITLGIAAERLDLLLPVVSACGLRPLVDPHDFTAKTNVLPCRDRTTDIRVDFIFSFSPYESLAIEHAQSVPMGNARVRFASPEDLIIHKMVAGRPRDMEDVKGVLLKNPDLDTAYIRRWLKQFSSALGRPLLRDFNAVRREVEEGSSSSMSGVSQPT